MPGNPRPQYERQERLRGDQGAVVFVAYISKEGHPSQFRLLKSTGFRNLDAKTLIALKKWRFYPGQEGWVELPFRWDLKGGAQEDGGLLRSKVSQN
ncbi:Gram-negative bacterial tonB protein [compost metagenome]